MTYKLNQRVENNIYIYIYIYNLRLFRWLTSWIRGWKTLYIYTVFHLLIKRVSHLKRRRLYIYCFLISDKACKSSEETKIIYIIYIYKVRSATVVEGDPKAPFSIGTTPKCREGCYSFHWIAPLSLIRSNTKC